MLKALIAAPYWVVLAGLLTGPAAAQEPKKDEPNKVQPGVPLVQFPSLPPRDADDLRRQIDEMQRQQQRMIDDAIRALQQGGAAGRLRPLGPIGPLGGIGGVGGIGGIGGMAAIPNIRINPRGGRGVGSGVAHETRLGALVELPTPTLIDQLDLPKDQGIVVNDVVPESAAAKAGLKAHDILLEVNGQAVPSKLDDFGKIIDGIKANEAVEAVVLRKGRKETVKGLTLPEMPQTQPANPGRGGNQRRDPANLQAGNGVSITVTRNNDQFTAHLRDGDVVVRVTGRVEGGQATADRIFVVDGKVTTYESIDKVPEQYRPAVQTLLESVTRSGARNRGR